MQIDTPGTLSPAQFARFSKLAYDNAGILLKPGKESLVLARVTRRLRALEMDSVEAYIAHLEGDHTGKELVHFLDVISTNVTSFFREKEHFDYLKTYVGEAAAAGIKRLRFWSAACSSGEEPYTLAMVLDEALGSAFDWRILATDVSTDVLGRAARGVYANSTVQAVPSTLRSRYMIRDDGSDPQDPLWIMRPELREKVLFRRVNLAQPPFPMRGPFDVVLCRNVMIYFDNIVRLGIVNEVERLLRPGGVFMTSHTESLTGLKINLRMSKPSIYVKDR
ncbi:MAG: CheR family methyltransferase [Myxococcota bacterium]